MKYKSQYQLTIVEKERISMTDEQVYRRQIHEIVEKLDFKELQKYFTCRKLDPTDAEQWRQIVMDDPSMREKLCILRDMQVAEFTVSINTGD
jgi:hypothetical protein